MHDDDKEDKLLRAVALRNAHSILEARERADEELQQAKETLRKQSEWLRVTLSSIGDGVIATDAEGRITFLNRVAETLTGCSHDEALGRPLPEVFRIVNEQTRQPAENPALRALREGAVVGLANHTILIAKDGTEHPIDDSAAPIRDEAGALLGAVLVFRDVTERRRSEATLRESDRRKDDFIALLAHELRNPLAPIRNGLQILRLSDGDRQTIEQARAVMDRQLSHMVRLIDDLLDISRISRNKMELRRGRVVLADVVGSAVETARPLIETLLHELVVSLPAEPIILDADHTRLAQVFSNLLTNSAKYTPPGGRIVLSAKRSGGTLTLSVSDNGIGIPAGSLVNIFDMFSQVDRSIERSAGGLGIGLALVKGLVEMHGGTVAAASEGDGKGSTFTISLPVWAGRTEAAGSAPADCGNLARGPGRRVLIVDDNRDGADSLATMLRLMGNEVRTASDGLQALEQAESFRPDVILMDVGMPKLNGLDATRRIRATPWGESITIIALTGWGQPGDRERSHEAGCDGHLVKPVDLTELGRTLAKARSRSGVQA
jgi:PAS domain S-box-containing protein